jgi:glutathione S-transferase
MPLSSKLLYAPRSPFARKARIFVHELGLLNVVELVPIDPWKHEPLRRHNPLCKVPTLILPDGSALYDSRVICDYLNHSAGGAMFPSAGPERWDALRREARGDGLAEAVIRRFVERLGPVNERSTAVARRQEDAIVATLASLDADPLNDDRFDIGDVATIVALAYLDFRSPEIGWRDRWRQAGAWFDRVSRRSSVTATAITPVVAALADKHLTGTVTGRENQTNSSLKSG